ncbi:MAG: 16S rRNA (guanine(966)-N(2))-methyltransferase RsmD [Anaerolineales bacterium]
MARGPGIRVIGGSVRGRRLRQVPGEGTRPISNRVRESLFNIIGADIVDASMLDLFGGTGSVGIEALSRGAQRVTFVEIQARAVETIRANLSATGLQARASVVQTDAFAYLKRRNVEPVDYVYIAPPQYRELWKKALAALDAHTGWLAADGWAIVQMHPGEYEGLHLSHVREFDQRKYGNTLLCFYERIEGGGDL